MAETPSAAIGSEQTQELVEEARVRNSRSARTQQTITTTRMVVQKSKQQVHRFNNAEDDSGFMTSTPVLGSTTVQSEHVGEESFTFPGTDNVGKKLQYTQFEDTEKSFTRVRSKKSRASSTPNPLGYTVRPKPGRPKSEDRKNDKGVEQHVFEDLSKSLLYTYLSDDLSESELNADQTDSGSLKQKSISYPLINTTADLGLNHVEWGRSHHWRREWYLNRWNLDSAKVHKKSWMFTLFQTVITTFITTFITIQTLMYSKTSKMLAFFGNRSYEGTAKTRRLQRMAPTAVSRSWYYVQTKHLRKPARRCFCIFCIPLFICMIAAVVLLIPSLKQSFYSFKEYQAPLNLTEHGLKNAYSIFLGKNTGQMPVWHVFPELRQNPGKEKSFNNGFPVVFYIREPGYLELKQRMEVFKTLSAAGYNIVIPVYPESGRRIIEPWKSIFKSTNGSANVYLWGDKVGASYMSDLAKDLCKEGVPPSGVIIITDVFDKDLPIHSYEVWSCNCSTVQKEDRSPFTYTHIKCPVSDTNIHHDITECLQALSR